MREVTIKRAAIRRFDSIEQEAYLALWRTYDKLRAIEDELFAKYDLTAQQYNALRLLRANHPTPVPTLTVASRLISRAPDITRLLDRLEDRGFVVRERPADNRRIVQISITQEGLSLLEELESQVRDCHARQLGHLKRDQLRALIDLLRITRAPHESDDSDWK